MASIPLCGICVGRGWGHICAGTIPPVMLSGLPPVIARAVDRLEATGQAKRKAMDDAPSVKAAEPVSGFAPYGQCAHCDAARVAAAKRQLTHRNRRNGIP
jgi:hypothetical protein